MWVQRHNNICKNKGINIQPYHQHLCFAFLYLVSNCSVHVEELDFYLRELNEQNDLKMFICKMRSSFKKQALISWRTQVIFIYFLLISVLTYLRLIGLVSSNIRYDVLWCVLLLPLYPTTIAWSIMYSLNCPQKILVLCEWHL